MERIPDRPEPDSDETEYPSGTEGPTETPGVDPEESREDAPGFEEDPPQAD